MKKIAGKARLREQEYFSVSFPLGAAASASSESAVLPARVRHGGVQAVEQHPATDDVPHERQYGSRSRGRSRGRSECSRSNFWPFDLQNILNWPKLKYSSESLKKSLKMDKKLSVIYWFRVLFRSPQSPCCRRSCPSYQMERVSSWTVHFSRSTTRSPNKTVYCRTRQIRGDGSGWYESPSDDHGDRAGREDAHQAVQHQNAERGHARHWRTGWWLESFFERARWNASLLGSIQAASSGGVWGRVCSIVGGVLTYRGLVIEFS